MNRLCRKECLDEKVLQNSIFKTIALYSPALTVLKEGIENIKWVSISLIMIILRGSVPLVIDNRNATSSTIFFRITYFWPHCLKEQYKIAFNVQNRLNMLKSGCGMADERFQVC